MSEVVITFVGDVPPVVRIDEEDFSALFRAHYVRLVRSMAVICGDGEVAADAVQEAFVRAHARWRTIREYDDPIGWVRHVALNLVRDDRRRHARRLVAVGRMAATAARSTPAPAEPDDVAAVLAELPRQQRVAAALFYVDGLSVAEVADAMGLAPGSVKSHLHDARRSLRRLLGGGA